MQACLRIGWLNYRLMKVYRDRWISECEFLASGFSHEHRLPNLHAHDERA